MNDLLKIDPSVLRETAEIIKIYCSKQEETMNSYLSNMNSLRSEWDDDKTIGKLLEEIKVLRANVEGIMNEIRATYPQYFINKAIDIESR